MSSTALHLEVTGDPFVVHLSLPRLPTSDGKRLRDAGGVQTRSGGRRRSLQRLLASLRRGGQKGAHLSLLPDCGSQVFYTEPDEPNGIVVSVGSFADPSSPPPTESGYHHRRHPWIGLPDSIERDDAGEVWASVYPLYEAGRYAEAADRGRELLEAYPHPAVFYNLACCESLAGRTADALEHLRRAIDLAERCRDLAKGDSDFDPIRDEPAFKELMEPA